MDSLRNFFKKLRGVLFYDREEGTKLGFALHWLINLAFIGAWCLGCTLVGLYFAKTGCGPELFESYLSHRTIFALNMLPGLLISLLFLFITGRVWPAVLSGGLFTLGVAIINYFKLLFRDDPLLFIDITNISEAAQISGGYTFTLTPALIFTAAAFVAAMVFSVLFMRARIRKAAVRIIGAVLIVALSAGAYVGLYASEEIYSYTSNLDVKFADGRIFNQWNDTDQYRCRGFMYPFIHSASEIVIQKPDGYDRKEAEATLASFGSDDIPEDKKVNVIAVMLEAYSDLSIYSYGRPSYCNAYEFFHKLQKESVYGNLVTNIFAGGTINTERCFLAGSTDMYLYRSAADSFVQYFSEQGYRTEFCHPGYEWFYNRRNVAEYMGFDRSYFREDRYHVEGSIMDDEQLFADLITLYEDSKAAGEPYFNFTVTYQNHGPYPDSHFFEPTKAFVEMNKLTLPAYRILTNYMEGISRTDAAMESFVEYFRGEEEPVVLVFFGDHKPWLGDNSYVYSEMGIVMNHSSEWSFRNYYITPYLIWANDAAKESLGNDFMGEGEDISPCFLMMKLFDLAGWEGDGYMKALRALHEEVNVVHTTDVYYENGKMTASLSDSNLEKLRTIEYLQYYRMRDAR